MDTKHQKLYLDEIALQCHFALDAYAALLLDIDTLKAGKGKPTSSKDKRALFRDLHSIFTHVGNISKLLWPSANNSKEKVEKRCAELRTLLNIPETGHLLEARQLRNRLEHYDEDLDEWIDRDLEFVLPGAAILPEFCKYPLGLFILGYDERRIFVYPEMCFVYQYTKNVSDDTKIIYLEPLVESLGELLTKVERLGGETIQRTYRVIEND